MNSLSGQNSDFPSRIKRRENILFMRSRLWKFTHKTVEDWFEAMRLSSPGFYLSPFPFSCLVHRITECSLFHLFLFLFSVSLSLSFAPLFFLFFFSFLVQKYKTRKALGTIILKCSPLRKIRMYWVHHLTTCSLGGLISLAEVHRHRMRVYLPFVQQLKEHFI